MERQTEVSIAPTDLHPRDAYRLFISVVVPRPIAWVSSMGADGSLNLAPFSFFNGVGGTPPTIMVSVGQRAGQPKDTLRNVRETGEFVVHIVNEEFADRMNTTSGEWPYDVNEFDLAKLDTLPCVHVKPPRIEGAPIAMEVRATQFIPVQDTHYTMILGQVLLYHIRESLLTPSTSVDPMRLRSIARLGGPDYTAIDRVFSMKRPDL